MKLHHIANLWTLLSHPWTLDEKLDAIVAAGFDGVCWAPSTELTDGLAARGLLFVGGMATGSKGQLKPLLAELAASGARHVNVQLGAHDTLLDEALELTLELMREGAALGLEPAVESHRGTCTETPEKLYALSDAYLHATGTLLPVSWDFSHYGVVKHLVPTEFASRLLTRPDLVQRARQFHLRPFNGHHAQVAITDAHGRLTREVEDWLPFAETVLSCWIDGNRDTENEIFVCPELGPREGGYALSTFPDSWEDAVVLRGEIDKMWQRLLL